MRAVTFPVRNSQRVEVYTQCLEEGYEIWVVGPSKVGRMVLTHYVTHDDLEARLEYARPHDLIWRESSVSDIPAAKHPSALEYEATIVRGKFIDREKKLGHSTATHLDLLNLLPLDRKAFTEAKKAIIGRWTDGVAEIAFMPNSKLELSCPPSHRLNMIRRIHGCDPDWWNFASWQLPLLNQERKCGTRLSVIRVDSEELHIEGSEHQDRIAHVFKRIGRCEDSTALTSKRSVAKTKLADHVAGVGTALLRQLEEAVINRNPTLANQLNPGLSAKDIREALGKANVTGAVESVIELYSWRNGMAFDESTPMEEASFFPEDIYQFMDLQAAIERWKSMNEASAQLRALAQGTEASGMFEEMTGQLFPLFSDGGTSTIAIDLTASKLGRVVVIEFECAEPVRQVYSSFEDFIADAIRANREVRSLSCFE